jgi:predicted acyl esterase
MRFGDEVDWRDAATVVQTVAAQPWSNGKVGMYGHSYPAWTQMMAAAARPPALKALVPTSGVYDLWSLLTRRGAPLTAGLGTAFAPAFTGTTGHQPPQGIRQICPGLLESYVGNTEASTTGDRNAFFQARDLRAASTPSSVPIMTSLGIISGVNDGHILQFEGMWDRLGADRTRFVLGQWSHETPTSHKKDWRQQVLGWFDHYLRDGPQTVPPGVVEYQDDSDAWHTTDRWPPASREQAMHLSADTLVPDGRPVEPVDASFLSADNDPGLRTDEPDEKTRLYNSTCGPHQVLFASPPLAEDAVVAGNFSVDLDLASTLPGGNLSAFLWRTKGDGACPDQTATWFGRALMDLRHWETPGRSRDFPTGTPTRVRFDSHPLAAKLRKGERIVLAIGGGSSELEPDPRHPRLTVTRGTLRLPVVGAQPGSGGDRSASGRGAALRFANARVARRCLSRRRFAIRLRRDLVRARVRVNGRRIRVARRGRRLRAVVDLRRMRRTAVTVRITGVTRTGRRVASTRRYRTCTPRRRVR